MGKRTLTTENVTWFCTHLTLLHPPTPHPTPLSPSPCRYIGALGARVICDNIPGLVNKQRQLCQRHPDLMRSIGEGAKEWIRECQHQFRHHRWNCSTLDRDHTVFGRVMLRSKRVWSSVSKSVCVRVCVCSFAYESSVTCPSTNLSPEFKQYKSVDSSLQA